MAPYQEKNQGTITTSSGYRQPDPLEVTRTTSNNSMSSFPDSETTSRVSATTTVFECDYDTNPTVLYQAIEAKQWEYAISLFTNRGNLKNDDIEEEEDASATWVVRKESDGKLRWRLLPLHAAIIFGSPLKLVELLLADYPLAAQCKDDRGMLPLHLAFRKGSSWDVIDELLTTYPLAVFVSDRKGRTPLKCTLSNSSPQQIQSVDSSVSGSYGQSSDPSNFQTIVGVLELYSKIANSGERKRIEQETRALAQASISQLQEAHQRQLVAFRKKTERDDFEAQQQIKQLGSENEELKKRLNYLENELAERDQSNANTTKTSRLTNADVQNNEKSKSVDAICRMLADSMVKQQKAYHRRVGEMMTNYQELVTEREAMRSIFLKDSTANQQKEAIALESFRAWFNEEDKKLSLQERSLLSSPPQQSIRRRADFETKKNESDAIPEPQNLMSSYYEYRTTIEATKETKNTLQDAKPKIRINPVGTTSSTATASSTTNSRVPSPNSDQQPRPLEKEPREAPT